MVYYPRFILAAVVAVMFSFSAHAENCPPLIDLVDETMELADQMGLSEEEIAEIEELRDEAEAQHRAGDDRACVSTIDEALEIIEP